MRASIFLFAFVVALGVLTNYFGAKEIKEEASNQTASTIVTPEVLSEDMQFTPTPILTVSPTPTWTTELTPTPVSNQQNPKTSNGIWIYPGATTISTGGGEIQLSTTEEPQRVTDWYKQIISSRMNTKSFVSTSTNGNVENKLSGANSGERIEVEIRKSDSDSVTYIFVR